MKNKLILSILTATLVSACGGASDAPQLPPTDIDGQPAVSRNQNLKQPDYNNPTAPGASDDSQLFGNTSRTIEQHFGTERNFNGTYTLLHKAGGAFESFPSSDSDNMTVTFNDRYRDDLKPLKLPTFAADDRKNGILIFNAANGRDGLSYRSFYVSDNNYQYTQIGNMTLDNGDVGMFARGNRTANMPTEGSFNYRGNGILNFLDGSNQYQRTELGRVQLAADFASKTYTLSMNSPTHRGMTSGTINNSELVPAAAGTGEYISASGTFTGPNAEEMYGQYNSVGAGGKEIITGHYAAKRQ